MTKKARIDQLERQVVELIGEVAKLKIQVGFLEQKNFQTVQDPPFYQPLKWVEPPYVSTWTTPNTIWPWEITSTAVTINNLDPDAAKALYQNRQELYVN